MFPSHPGSYWHYIDFVTLVSLTFIITALVKSHHKKTGALLGSISQTVAYSKASSIIFSIAMTIFFPLYYAYIWFGSYLLFMHRNNFIIYLFSRPFVKWSLFGFQQPMA